MHEIQYWNLEQGLLSGASANVQAEIQITLLKVFSKSILKSVLNEIDFLKSPSHNPHYILNILMFHALRFYG